MKTEWDLSLLYSSDNDPQIEKDIITTEKACTLFAETYRNNETYLHDEHELFKALTDFETLSGMPEAQKPAAYFHYRKDLNSDDKKADSELNRISERLTKAYNTVIFFELSLGKIPKNQQKKFLVSKKLAHFCYFLKRIFINAEHHLTEAEEKILNLKTLPSHSMWVRGQLKLLNGQMVRFQGKDIPLPEAMNMMSELPVKTRRKLNQEVNGILKGISHFAESEINAVYTNKKINDELRGFKEPYSETILGYQNDEASIVTFVNTISSRFDISHRFYRLKAKLLKLSHLEYADRAAKIGKVHIKLSFEECVNTLRKIFTNMGGRYAAIFERYLERGHIDVYPKRGKKGGAYCSGSIGLPTYILLNHVDNLSSYKTLAHELGHAFHTELSKSQTPLYESYTISVAEVASTLFEEFAFDYIFNNLSEKEKIILLHDRINDGIATVFRQIACFNYELDLHRRVRTAGAVSKEEMATLHNKHMKAYLGPAFAMKDDDGYFFVQWPHLRYFFYVYSYAYGALISKALYKRYKKDKNYLKDIETFLSAGGSKSPEEIFKDIGIDTLEPEFFEEGLRSIEEDIELLEKLTKK